MIHRLHIRLMDAEGALLRLLGTTERRGFRVIAMHAQVGADAVCQVELTVDGTRDAELLGRQLERLHEVQAATITTPRIA